MLLQVTPNPSDRTACAHSADKNVHPPIGLMPDFRASRPVVSLRICGVSVLVRHERVGNFLVQFLCDLNVVLWRIMRHRSGCDYDLRAKRSEKISLLLAHLVGHCEDHLVALDRRTHCQTHTSVSRSRLDYRRSRS